MQSETIGALAAALAKAQGAIKPASMDRDNPFFKSKYATLTSLWDASRAALAANGLAVTQTTDVDSEGNVALLTTLLHTSGEWVGGIYPVRAADNKPQSLGSAITYARRYAFAALLGLVSDDDDDGNAANGAPPAQHKPQAQAPTPKPNGAPRQTPQKTVIDGQEMVHTVAGYITKEAWNEHAQRLAEDVDQSSALPKVTNGESKVSEGTLRRLHAVGVEFYGDKWDGERHRLVKAVTTGATESSRDLTEKEARKLVSGIEKRLSERQAVDNPFADEQAVPA